jgi:malonyl-CoA/methylmalonyl-CoA synthetase
MTNPLYDALFAPHEGKSTPFLHLADGETLSHAAFLASVNRTANALVALGVTPGDRVAVHVTKSPQALALYAACVKSGAVFLPLNTAYTPRELDYFVGDSGAKVFVCDPAEEAAVQDIAAATGAVLTTLGADGQGSLSLLAATQEAESEAQPRDRDDLVALLYTSGTTGRSKGAMLTHENLLSNAAALVDTWGFTADDVLLHALPIFHSHGLFVATNVMLLAGGAMIFLPKFDVETVLAQLPRASTMMGVPTFYTRLLEEERFSSDLTAHMRLFISGSAPLLAETHKLFEARTGHRILERYGMTETSMNTSNPYDAERRAGTVGFPLPGVDVKVCDAETGAEMPTGEIGVLWVRGPNVFKGYWQMPNKTREELRADGFFITGDLSLIDERGYVHIVGRGKDLIISGGYNIYPKEIEMFLDALPGVKESAVIGAPHPDFGESVVAVLVAEDGAHIDPATIAAQTKADLAGFKRPRHIEVLPELPRNTMGKVQKNQIREQFADVFQRVPTQAPRPIPSLSTRPVMTATPPPIAGGVIAPSLTPFEDDLSIAKDLYLENVHRLIEDGCAALALFGTTGEAASVSIAERLELLEHLTTSGIDPARLIPGTGLTSLSESADLTRRVVDMGCAGAMILPPYYYKGVSDEGLYDYFARLIEQVGRDTLAVYLYHIPQVSGVGLSIELVARLKQAFPEQIVGIKDSGGDWANTRALFDIEGLTVYPGSELPLFEALELGGPGCITATANVNTRAIKDVVDLHRAGKMEEARAAFEVVRKLRLIVQDYAPIPAQKRLLALRSGDHRWANVRPPLEPLSEARGHELADRLRREVDFDIEGALTSA